LSSTEQDINIFNTPIVYHLMGHNSKDFYRFYFDWIGHGQ